MILWNGSSSEDGKEDYQSKYSKLLFAGNSSCISVDD